MKQLQKMANVGNNGSNLLHQVAFGTPTPTAPRTKPFEFKLVTFNQRIYKMGQYAQGVVQFFFVKHVFAKHPYTGAKQSSFLTFCSGKGTRALQRSVAWKTPMELKTGQLLADSDHDS